MNFCKILYQCINVQNYRTTIKLHDIKFRKTDNIWNQLLQKTIIVEMSLSRTVWLGKKDSCRNVKILVETSAKVFKSAVRL